MSRTALTTAILNLDLKSYNPGTSTSLSDRDFMKIRSLSGVKTNMLDGIITILRIAWRTTQYLYSHRFIGYSIRLYRLKADKYEPSREKKLSATAHERSDSEEKASMFDLTLVKDLIEVIGKSLTFTDIEIMGKYFFKDFSAHKLANISNTQTISPTSAAKILVETCIEKNKAEDLFKFVIELDGSPLNGKTVKLNGLENVLYRLARTGIIFDFSKRKFTNVTGNKKLMPNWGILKTGREYELVVASIDICSNSELVKKHKPPIMEKVYYQFSEFLKRKTLVYDARIWSWAGDGGLVAFRNNKGPSVAVECLLDLLLGLPVFNALDSKGIDDDICIRIAADTGRIVSDVINYAAHLEKLGTSPGGFSVSDTVYGELGKKMKCIFSNKIEFEGRNAYTLTYDFVKALC
jgi:class 3 adenylate cyclase